MREGGNSQKRTYVEGVHVKRTGTNKGMRGVKNWKFRLNVLFECPLFMVSHDREYFDGKRFPFPAMLKASLNHFSSEDIRFLNLKFTKKHLFFKTLPSSKG